MSYARNCQFSVKPGKVDEFNRLMNTEILPLLNDAKGFRQDLTMLGGHTVTSISVWDDRACADTYHTKTYPVILSMLRPVLDGTPRVNTYDSTYTLIH